MAIVSAALLALALSSTRAAYAAESSAVAGAAIPPAKHVATLTARVPASARKQAAKQALFGAAASPPYVNALAGVAADSEYATNITIGGQSFPVLVDTGTPASTSSVAGA
jgi:predicted aspartyl protease